MNSEVLQPESALKQTSRRQDIISTSKKEDKRFSCTHCWCACNKSSPRTPLHKTTGVSSPTYHCWSTNTTMQGTARARRKGSSHMVSQCLEYCACAYLLHRLQSLNTAREESNHSHNFHVCWLMLPSILKGAIISCSLDVWAHGNVKICVEFPQEKTSLTSRILNSLKNKSLFLQDPKERPATGKCPPPSLDDWKTKDI